MIGIIPRFSIGLVFVLAVGLPATTMAQDSLMYNRQLINIVIGSDYLARGTWSIPFARASDPRAYVYEPVAYGTAASTRYHVTGVTNASGESVASSQVYDEVIGFPFDPRDKNVLQVFKVNYLLTPAFKAPVAIYEFLIADGSERLSPNLKISFPQGWKVLSTWPSETVVSGNSIEVEYAQTRKQVRPVLVAFQTNGAGVVRQIGKYTVSGTAEEVQKLEAALALLSTVDADMMATLGIRPPEKVLIVSDDLSSVGDIGFEAEAIAANPNVIVFNNQLAKSKTTEEIAEILAHEFVHLAMNDKELFSGRYRGVPFFDEGLAVYFQGVIHRKLFSDTRKRLLNEGLIRTHTVSPSEALVLYESAFDTEFDGTRNLGTGASYKHAGLTVGRFADKAGLAGFQKLIPALQSATSDGYGKKTDSDIVFEHMASISGLSVSQLKYPGQQEGDVQGVVSRISRSEGNLDETAEIVSSYIKNGIKHYFSSNPTVGAVEPVKTVSSPPAATNAARITSQIGLGASGTQVVSLQNFLEGKGFLKLPAGVAKGNFGQMTRVALQAFQRSIRLSPTGSTGPQTRAAINAAQGL